MNTKNKSFPWDYVLVLLTLIIANGVTAYLVNNDLLGLGDSGRSLSYRRMVETIENLPPPQEIDLLILGDSRSQVINVKQLSKELGLDPEMSLNASTVSGSWVTAFSLLRKVEAHLTSNSQVVLCVSEFWLEKANYQQSSGLVPSWKDYLLLNKPRLGIASLLPLSRKRDIIAHKLKLGVAGGKIWLGAWWQKGNQEKQKLNEQGLNRNEVTKVPRLTSTGEGLEKQPKVKLRKSNVDSWFSPISLEQLEGNLIFAANTLKKIREIAPNLTLVYLPNAKIREYYVDKTYPGRKKRFMQNIKQLAEKHDLPFIDMSGELDQLKDPLIFVDFHHWNGTGAKIGTEKLANLLTSSRNK